MAAIVDEHNLLDLDHLNSSLQKSLPGYARPLFIRIKKSVDTTGAFYCFTQIGVIVREEYRAWINVLW